MYGLFEEGLSIGDFLKKNIPDNTPITIASEENYQYESYIKDWEEFFCGYVQDFLKDTSDVAQRLRNHRDFVYKFDDINTDMLIITAIDFDAEDFE